MKTRRVTLEEAQAAFTREFQGEAFSFGDICGGRITSVMLPAVPVAGDGHGTVYLPLAYQVTIDGRTETVETGDGPGVDELRSFLYGTLPDLTVGEKLELWFEDEIYPGDGSCGCGCGC